MKSNLANILTLSRIAAIPLVIGALYLPQAIGNWIALLIFASAGVTDWLDGYVARTRGEVSSFGRIFDPIADKLLVASVLMVLVALDRIGGWSIIPAIIILCREVLVSGLREFLAQIEVRVPVSILAKWKTGVQMVAIGFVIVGDAFPPILPVAAIGIVGLWVAAVVTLYTGYDYMRAGLRHMTPEADAERARRKKKRPRRRVGRLSGSAPNG